MKFATPDEAEGAFYRALERADLAAMMGVWAEDEEVICVHPSGERLLGLDAVRESWRQIFARGPHLRIEALEVRVHGGRMLAIHNLTERITLTERPRPTQFALATNVYVLTRSGWRMLIHHASPLPEGAIAPSAPPGTIH